MQYTSRIFIKFKDKLSWETALDEVKIGSESKRRSLLSFKNDPFAGFEYLENGITVSEETLSCTLSDFFDENTTLSLFKSLVRVVSQNGIVIADTYSYSGDPICFEYYYFGGEIHEYVRTRAADNHFDIEISDVNKWLGPTRKKSLTSEEKALLKSCL